MIMADNMSNFHANMIRPRCTPIGGIDRSVVSAMSTFFPRRAYFAYRATLAAFHSPGLCGRLRRHDEKCENYW